MKIVNLNNFGKVQIAFLIALMICAFALPVSAHKVSIFAYVEGNNIHTESYFPDGKPVQNGRVEVLNSEGVKLLEGVTDAEGKFSVPILAKDDLTVLIHASMGHKSSFLLKRSQAGE